VTTVSAKDAIVGQCYHSPKGVPCKIMEISESSVTVKSLITAKEIIVPLDLPMVRYEDHLDESNYSNKTVKKSD
jgi:hypothetical protein